MLYGLLNIYVALLAALFLRPGLTLGDVWDEESVEQPGATHKENHQEAKTAEEGAHSYLTQVSMATDAGHKVSLEEAVGLFNEGNSSVVVSLQEVEGGRRLTVLEMWKFNCRCSLKSDSWTTFRVKACTGYTSSGNCQTSFKPPTQTIDAPVLRPGEHINGCICEGSSEVERKISAWFSRVGSAPAYCPGLEIGGEEVGYSCQLTLY